MKRAEKSTAMRIAKEPDEGVPALKECSSSSGFIGDVYLCAALVKQGTSRKDDAKLMKTGSNQHTSLNAG